MKRLRLSSAVAMALLVAAVVSLGSTQAKADPGNGVVRVPKGEPVQIAVVVDTKSPIVGFLGVGFRNAIQMAVGQRTIRGFAVQLNVFTAPCLVQDDPDAIALNAEAAEQIAANPQNAAVIGHECSLSFGNVGPVPSGDPCPGPTSGNALSIYESHEIVTINGSTTNPCLPLVGPTVFNGTAVPGDAFDAWYQRVQALPTDAAWRLAYQQQFGIPASDFADLYYDAANVLVDRLQKVAKIANGNLVISRSALAEAVRGTTGFCGVTGTLSLDAGGYRIDAPVAC